MLLNLYIFSMLGTNECPCPQVMEYILARHMRCRYRERVAQLCPSFMHLRQQDCQRYFHLQPEAVNYICHLTGPYLEKQHRGVTPLPVALTVTAALTFNPTGSFQHPLASMVRVSRSALGSEKHAVFHFGKFRCSCSLPGPMEGWLLGGNGSPLKRQSETLSRWMMPLHLLNTENVI